jgi:hypothetical protein
MIYGFHGVWLGLATLVLAIYGFGYLILCAAKKETGLMALSGKAAGLGLVIVAIITLIAGPHAITASKKRMNCQMMQMKGDMKMKMNCSSSEAKPMTMPMKKHHK